MTLDYKSIMNISKKYGDSFYVLDTKQFDKNYNDLLSAFKKHYINTHIAYSYKTNYIPDLCKIIDKNGGYAEIVSEMEYKLAKSIGVNDSNIYYNGPYKSKESIESLLINGGYLNIDSLYEVEIVEKIADKYKNKILKVGIRCNFKINDNVLSRFGIDSTSSVFDQLIRRFNEIDNIRLVGLHLHIATRSLNTWKPRVAEMIKLIKNKFDPHSLEYISFGGGFYGNMNESLKKQFSDPIPDFNEYAEIVAIEFAKFAKNYNVERTLKLLIEPGSALAGDSMRFVSKVINIKNVRDKAIATLAGSIYNINPTLNKKNPPIQIVQSNELLSNIFTSLDFAGFTCIESDYLYRNYSGKLAVNDYVIFNNVGSYSIVLKPPFILPNFTIIKFVNNKIVEVKRKETFNDLFFTYKELTNE